MTSIAVKENTWEQLNKLKKVGDTMDDVISRILEDYTEKNSNYDTNTISDADFNLLLDELITDDIEFNSYLEKSRKSFSREKFG